jgi:hypothetical protein
MSSSWSIIRVEGRQRGKVAAFMAAEFSRHFAATIDDDTDEVYAVVGPHGQLEAAFGLSRHIDHFFSRHYLGDVRASLNTAYTNFAQDARVVEFAHLCVRKPRSICRLLPILAEFLARQADYLICTATRELALFFSRRGLAPNVLGKADVSLLPLEERSGWGVYYDHVPMVLSGSLHNACAQLIPQPHVSEAPQWREVPQRNEVLEVA